MHKQSHQNTHPTFTYRKGRIFYFRRKSHVICVLTTSDLSLLSRLGLHRAHLLEGRKYPLSAFRRAMVDAEGQTQPITRFTVVS